MLQKYLQFAKKEDVPLRVITKNKKEMKIKLLAYSSKYIKYRFLNNNNEGTINVENVESCTCLKDDDEIKFNKYIIQEKFKIINLEDKIKNFENYYLEIINLLLSMEEKDSKRIS